MNGVIPTIVILATAYVCIFAAAFTEGLRPWFGVQIDLIPSLMVYTALTTGPGSIALLAFWSGLWMDCLSSNPPGATTIPLLLTGILVHANRSVILREELFAQSVLGAGASVVAPLVSCVVLRSAGQEPMIGIASLWHLFVLATAGLVLCPLLFRLLDIVTDGLCYPLAQSTAIRLSREIKRGRN